MTYVATGASSWWIHTIHDSYDSLYLYRFVWHRTMWWKKLCKDHVYIHWKHTTYFEQSAIPLANLLTGAQHVTSVLDLLGRAKEYDVRGGIVNAKTHEYPWLSVIRNDKWTAVVLQTQDPWLSKPKTAIWKLIKYLCSIGRYTRTIQSVYSACQCIKVPLRQKQNVVPRDVGILSTWMFTTHAGDASWWSCKNP